ncbi:hypothetical protein JCM19302_1155 [Jejuia pallidilutea]|uniref:Uncharacterized protein n=1 Tax=Jejuia pallidilutea TaxID=504487 RepID=A0A090W879_9FLAO|nr:hypothetical protein JCM19302_1155 [Jejuia pallidilutea]
MAKKNVITLDKNISTYFIKEVALKSNLFFVKTRYENV